LFAYPCAFPGVNPKAPPLPFFLPLGRSVYNGLQTKLTQNVQHPFGGLRGLNIQVAYALSRFENDGGGWTSALVAATAASPDQDLGPQALDNANPHRYFGPAVLDRTRQLSFGGYADLRGGFQLSWTGPAEQWIVHNDAVAGAERRGSKAATCPAWRSQSCL